jgi:protein O-mannosyl-transferase
VKRFSRFGPIALVVVLACAVYAQTVRYDFTFDDVLVIVRRPLFHDIGDWRNILGASWWTNKTLYRPLTALTFAANWSLGHGSPHPFHVFNVLLHAATCALVLLLARRVLGTRAGLVAALLFAVHPVHVEAVANVVGRAEVLSTLFAVLAVLCYQWDGDLADAGDHSSLRRVGATLGTIACTALALASKESAFAVPGLLLLSDLLDADRAGRPFEEKARRHILLWVAVIVVGLVWLALRARIVGDLTGREVAPGLEGLGLVARTKVMLAIVPHYFRLLFFPLKLSADYSPDFVPAIAEWTVRGMFGAALVLLTAGVALAARRRAPIVTFAIGWTAATIAIVANVLVPTGVLLAERTLYLPSVGAVLLLGWLWTLLDRRWPVAAVATAALFVLAGTARTVTRNPVWRSNATVLPSLVRDAPGSYHAVWVAGMLAAERNRADSAEWYLRKALVIRPLAPPVWRDLASLLDLEGRYGESATAFWTSWRLDHERLIELERAVLNGVKAGQVDTAEARLNEALSVVPKDRAEVRLAQAEIAMARGQPRKAMTLRRLVAFEFPTFTRSWELTAEAALAAHDCIELARSTSRMRAINSTLASLPRLEAGLRDLACP